MRLSNKRLKVFSGNANKELAEDICQCLGLDLGLGELLRFKDGEIRAKIGEFMKQTFVCGG